MPTPDERTAAMDALIADSADMIDAPAMGEVETMTIMLPPAADVAPDYLEGWVDGQTYLIANYSKAFATASLSAMSPAGEVERLREALAQIAYEEPERPWVIAHNALKATAQAIREPKP